MSDDYSWPEQDAVDKWWLEHSHELKVAVTDFRIKQDAVVRSLTEENSKLAEDNRLLTDRVSELSKRKIDLESENFLLKKVPKWIRNLFCGVQID